MDNGVLISFGRYNQIMGVASVDTISQYLRRFVGAYDHTQPNLRRADVVKKKREIQKQKVKQRRTSQYARPRNKFRRIRVSV